MRAGWMIRRVSGEATNKRKSFLSDPPASVEELRGPTYLRVSDSVYVRYVPRSTCCLV